MSQVDPTRTFIATTKAGRRSAPSISLRGLNLVKVRPLGLAAIVLVYWTNLPSAIRAPASHKLN